MKKTNLFVFDGQSEQLLAVLSNEDNEMSPYWEAPLEENLNGDFIFEFKAPVNDALVEGNLVAFKDMDGDFQLFQIYKANKYHIDGELLVHVWCEHAFYEMADDIVTDLRVTDGTAQDAMTKALSASRWQVGTVADLGTGTVNFYYAPATQNLQDVVAAFGGELKYRVTISGNKITGRFVDLLARRGSDTGKRFEWNKDLVEVNRTVEVDGLKTALYGRGNGDQIDDTNGYTRKVTFADVVWSVANGDPVDKPQGQEWVGDPTALETWGRLNSDGTMRHRFGTFDVDSTDPATILQQTWEQLQKVNVPNVSYELKVIDLEKIAGFSFEKVRIGDTVYVIDNELGMRIDARVVKITYSLDSPEDCEVILGNFIEDITDYNKKLNTVEATLNDRKGVWDNATQNQGITNVDDSDIVNEAPATPTNPTAIGLFKSIIVKWDFDPSIKVAAYELYGSRVEGFTIDSSNLLFRGKTGGFVVDAGTNEQWYFRLRAVNPQGVASAYTAEFSAQTIQIGTPDFEELSVTDAIIKDVSADKMTVGTLDAAKVDVINLDADNINTGKLKAQYVEIGSQTTFDKGYNPAPIAQKFYDYGFQFGQQYWSDSYTGQFPDSTTVGMVQASDDSNEGGNSWTITGDHALYSVNAQIVNPSRTYQVTFRVKQTADPTTAGTSNISAGVVCLDGNFIPISTTFGAVRAFVAKDSPLTTTDDWQEYTGQISGTDETDTTFGAGTVYVRPFFHVNATGGDGTVEVDYIKFEDVTEIFSMQQTLNDVDLRTSDDSIIATVTQSQTYQNDMLSKANSSDLANYATTDDLTQAQQDAQDYTDKAIGKIDFSPYVTQSQLTETNNSIDAKFSAAGGVNLVKNSVGFADKNFWDEYSSDHSTEAVTNDGLTALGFTSGFHFPVTANNKGLTQTISVVAGQTYTLSWYLNKLTSGSDSSYRFWIQIQEDANGDGTVETVKQIDDNSAIKTDGYEQASLTYTPVTSQIIIRFVAYPNVEAYVTGIMLNVGELPLQWSLAVGEVYNTNVQMDLNGIKVYSNVYDGYTIMSPEEFSGYANIPDENNNLVMTKVFTLNKDTTVMNKATVEDTLTMSPCLVIPVTSSSYNGLAFIAEE